MYNELLPRTGSANCRAALPSFFCCLSYRVSVLPSGISPAQESVSEPVTGSVSEANQTPGNLGDFPKWPGPRRQEYFSTSGNQLTGDTQSNGLSESLLASASKVKWNVAQPGSGPVGTSSRHPFPF